MKEVNDLISIVIPVYNVQEYLDRCIISVIEQTYTNLQIILVDDGSTDNSGQICDSYARKNKRIEVIHKKNGGLSDARNIGIKTAKGKYITFIDSDDYVELDYVEYLYNLIKKYSVDISICRHVVHHNTENLELKKTEKMSKWNKEMILKNILYSKTFEVSAWGKMYKLSLFNNIEFPVGKLFEDVDTTYKLIDKCDYVSVGFEQKYHYIMRKGSIVNNDFTEKHKYMITSTENMCNYIEKKYPNLKKACKRRRTYAYMSTLNRMITSSNGNINEEIKYRNTIIKNYSVVFDLNSSLRDKVGIISLFFGLNFYKKIWNFYRKKTGRC